jgi:hypothetical protein
MANTMETTEMGRTSGGGSAGGQALSSPLVVFPTVQRWKISRAS